MDLPEPAYVARLSDRGFAEHTDRFKPMSREQLRATLSKNQTYGPDVADALLSDVDRIFGAENGLVFQMRSGVTGKMRDFAEKIAVIDPASGKARWEYNLKQIHSSNEVSDSTAADEDRLGPRVVYARKDMRRGIMLEDYFPEEWRCDRRVLTPVEETAVGGSLAEKTHRMVQAGRIHGDHFRAHMFYVGGGESIEPFFVDWGRVTHREPGVIDGVTAKSMMQQTFGNFSPGSWQAFKKRLFEVASGREREVYSEVLYGKAEANPLDDDLLMKAARETVERRARKRQEMLVESAGRRARLRYRYA